MTWNYPVYNYRRISKVTTMEAIENFWWILASINFVYQLISGTGIKRSLFVYSVYYCKMGFVRDCFTFAVFAVGIQSANIKQPRICSPGILHLLDGIITSYLLNWGWRADLKFSLFNATGASTKNLRGGGGSGIVAPALEIGQLCGLLWDEHKSRDRPLPLR